MTRIITKSVIARQEVIPVFVRDEASAVTLNAAMPQHWIEQRLNAIGRNKAGLAKALGVERPRISEILRGKRKVQEEEVGKLAKYLKLPTGVVVSRLGRLPDKSDDLTPVYVRGAVQAGFWSEQAQLPEDEWEEVFVPGPSPKQAVRYALRVKGPSMNQVFPEGSTLIVEDIHSYSGPIKSGYKVICQRVHKGKFETTVKELQIEGKRYWLWPRSNHPEHQQPIEVPSPDKWHNGHDVGTEDGIYVIGVVVASHRTEIPE